MLFLPDLHSPYHDARALALITHKVLPSFAWDTLVILGDWFDCYAVSRFSKDPRRLSSIKAELATGFGLLRAFENHPFQRRIFVEGNHEKRLSKSVGDKAPELYEWVMDKWHDGFPKGKWEYIPYMEDAMVGKVHVTHDVGYSGMHSTKQSLHAYQDNVVIGHNHVLDYAVRGNAKGINHVGASFGWLGDAGQIDYAHKMKVRTTWSLGFGVGYLRPNGFMYLQPCPILDYSCVLEGELFQN